MRDDGFEAIERRLVRISTDPCLAVQKGQRMRAATMGEAVLAEGEAAAIDGAVVTRDGREVPMTMALAPTRTAYAIDGAALLVMLRAAEGRRWSVAA